MMRDERIKYMLEKHERVGIDARQHFVWIRGGSRKKEQCWWKKHMVSWTWVLIISWELSMLEFFAYKLGMHD